MHGVDEVGVDKPQGSGGAAEGDILVLPLLEDRRRAAVALPKNGFDRLRRACPGWPGIVRSKEG